VFIKECLCKYYGGTCGNVKILKTSYGKPYVEGLDINISLSHTEDIIVMGISEGVFGLDIEKIKERDYLKTAERFYTEKEIEKVREKGIKEFYRLWTMKEAHSKMKGKNLDTRITEEKIKGEGYKIITHNLEDYLLTVVCSKDEEIIIT